MMDDKVVPELTVDDKIVAELTIPENVAKALLLVSNSSSLDKALEKLIELAKEAGGRNQNEFLQQKGVEIVVDVITSVGFTHPDRAIIRVGLQLLGNYSVGGGERQCDVWHQLFPHKFLKIAGLRSRQICDPLCMVIYTCCDGADGLLTDLCLEQGLPILIEILRTHQPLVLKKIG